MSRRRAADTGSTSTANEDLSPENDSKAPETSSDLTPCSMYLEELTTEHGLTVRDECSFCRARVYRHQRAPGSSRATSAPTLSLPSPVAEDKSSYAIATLVGILPLLPKWNNHTVCRTFLQRISQVLSTTGLAEKEWVKVLPLLVRIYTAKYPW